MNDHDAAALEGNTVVCACGRRFPGRNEADARRSHERHFNIQRARAALETGREAKG